MKKLDVTTLHTLQTRFDALPHQQKLRPYDVIAALVDPISEARARGYDLDELVELLNEAGIRLSRNTVRNYLSRARRDRAEPTRTDVVTPEEDSTLSMDQASREESTGAAPSPSSAAQVLANARARAQTLRASSDASATQRAPGSFELVPDSEI